MVLPLAFSQMPGWLGGLTGKAAGTTLFIYRSSWLDSARLQCPEEIRDCLPGGRKHTHWLSKYLGAALPLVFRSLHSWAQLFTGWLEYGERGKNTKKQPNTLAVAHLDSASQFSQSRFPTQIAECWIWSTLCERAHVCVSVAGPGEVGGCNRRASSTAGSHFVDLASLAAKPRPLERTAPQLLAVSVELVPGLS